MLVLQCTKNGKDFELGARTRGPALESAVACCNSADGPLHDEAMTPLPKEHSVNRIWRDIAIQDVSLSDRGS